MSLTLFDTLRRKKRLFQPQDENRVTIYVCGPTVYDAPHIGNARPAVVFDVLVRLLRRLYGRVVYARNITDVEDKILAAAVKRNIPPEAVAQEYTQVYHDDMRALGVLEPDIEPKVTENMEGIKSLITRLLETKNAYEAEGHVLFHVPSWESYGKLSRRDRDGMIAGARVETAPYKRDPADFVLWKPSTPKQSGWESPWGRGRPGWHIECSAMIEAHLGETIDIHGGGHDLVFPHHENECAQSACAHDGKPLANFWMHNGFVKMGEDKMSKSLGNILTVRQLRDDAPGEAIRYALLSAHYRHPLTWSNALLNQSRRNLDRLYNILAIVRGSDASADDVDVSLADESFVQALHDDLNTPKALSILFRIRNQIIDDANSSNFHRWGEKLVASGRLLGLLQMSPREWSDWGRDAKTDSDIDALLAEREQARKNGNFVRADEIREHLAERGIIIEDTAEGSKWYRRAGEKHE